MKAWRWLVVAGMALWIVSMFLPTLGAGSDGRGYAALYWGTLIAYDGKGTGVERWMFILACVGNVTILPGTIFALVWPKSCRGIAPLMLPGVMGAIGIGCLFIGGNPPLNVGYFAWAVSQMIFTAGCAVGCFCVPTRRVYRGFAVEMPAHSGVGQA